MATRLYLHYDENRLVEPKAQTVRSVAQQLGEHLHQKYQLGNYRDKTQINEILQLAFTFLKRKLGHLMRRLASHEFMEFVLHQYDVAATHSEHLPNGTSLENMRSHSELAVRRRALKHLAERTAMGAPPAFAPLHFSNLFTETEEAILCSEMMVILYQMSDRTYCLFPEHTQLTLFSRNEIFPIQVLPLPPYERLDIDLNRRIAKETESRKKWFPDGTFDRDLEMQAQILDAPFSEAFGLTYREFVLVLTKVIEDAIPASRSYPVTFYLRMKLLLSRLFDELLTSH